MADDRGGGGEDEAQFGSRLHCGRSYILHPPLHYVEVEEKKTRYILDKKCRFSGGLCNIKKCF